MSSSVPCAMSRPAGRPAPGPGSVPDRADLATLLIRLGLSTLGAVAALAPDAVLARFGTEGRRIHALSRGIDPGPSVLVAPPPDLVERAELDPPAERVDVVVPRRHSV